MLKKILETIGTRYLTAILNLALIFINAKALGLAGVGTIGLLLASVNIGVIINGILSGNTLVYFMRRYPVMVLLKPAYWWTLAGSALACAGILITDTLPQGYWLHVYLLSILTSLVTANSRFLLGKENIRGFNVTHLVQGGFLFLTAIFFYYYIGKQDVISYVWSIYIANSLALLVSLYLLFPYLKEERGGTGRKVLFNCNLIKRNVRVRAMGRGRQSGRGINHPVKLFSFTALFRACRSGLIGCGY
ncbi:MAG: hypothetical protein LUD74_05265 [Tannerellaceae bacterium]|nr:hypothetical protein [Tannerellaceae bacterium]